jgi:ribosome maturation protein Sdo1
VIDSKQKIRIEKLIKEKDLLMSKILKEDVNIFISDINKLYFIEGALSEQKFSCDLTKQAENRTNSYIYNYMTILKNIQYRR